MDPGSVLSAWSAEAILKSDFFYVQIFALSLLHSPFPHVRAPLFSRVLLAEGKGQGRKQEMIPVSVTCSPGLAPSYQQSVRQGYQDLTHTPCLCPTSNHPGILASPH